MIVHIYTAQLADLMVSRSRTHEHTISLRFLSIILRVLKLEVFVYNVYISNQFETTFAEREEGSKIR
jgi:hypothetical protein